MLIIQLFLSIDIVPILYEKERREYKWENEVFFYFN